MRKVGRLIGAGVVGALVAAVVIRSAGAPPTAPRPAGAGRVTTVDIVGDSLITQSSAALAERLADAQLDARVVHRPQQDLGSTFVREELAAVRARPRADVLVLATAANDALRDRDRTLAAGASAASAAFAELLDLTLEPFQDRCVVLVNAREDIADIYHPDHARSLNAMLADARDRHPNLVLVDWAETSRSLPSDSFAADHLHFGPDAAAPSVGSASAQAYADAIVDGIRRC